MHSKLNIDFTFKDKENENIFPREDVISLECLNNNSSFFP